MANETQQEREQEQQYQQGQGQSAQWPQSTFDQLFGDQIVNSGIDPTGRDAWQAYFELAEQTLRTARRVSEIQVLSLMQTHIVKQVTAQVIGQFQRNPQLIPRCFSRIRRCCASRCSRSSGRWRVLADFQEGA